MKLKDYWKLNRDINDDNVNRYLKENNIPREFYDEGKKKEHRFLFGTYIALGVLLLSMLCISACSPKAAKVTTPVVNEKALHIEEPLRAYDPLTATGYIDIHNYTTDKFVAHDYSYNRNITILPNGSSRVSFTNAIPHKTIRVYDADAESFVYYIPYSSSDTSIQRTSTFSDEGFTQDVSNVDYNDLFIMPAYNSKSMYLDLSLIGDINPNTDFTRQILGYSTIDTNGNYLYGNYFNTSSFKPNLKQEYSNIQGNTSYNMIKFKYNIRSVGFGYQIDTSIWAVNTGSDASLMLASNCSSSTYRINVHGDYVEFEPYSTNSVSYLDSYYLAPYLVDSKLTATGNYFSCSSNNYTSRLLFSENKSNSFKTAYLYDSNGSEDLWNEFSDLFKVVFIAFSSLSSIYILPMVTIGALVIAPLIVGFIMLIIKVLRK